MTMQTIKTTDDIEERRRQRREYQRQYRKGLIPPREPKIVRRHNESGDVEPRRSFAYYLPQSLAERLKEHCKSTSKRRREVVVEAIERYLASGSPQPASDRTESRRFLYDEIPSDLMDRIQEITSTEGKPRVLKTDLAASAIQTYLDGATV